MEVFFLDCALCLYQKRGKEVAKYEKYVHGKAIKGRCFQKWGKDKLVDKSNYEPLGYMISFMRNIQRNSSTASLNVTVSDSGRKMVQGVAFAPFKLGGERKKSGTMIRWLVFITIRIFRFICVFKTNLTTFLI